MKNLARIREGRSENGGRHTNNLRYEDDIIFLSENSHDLKQHVMKVKEESGRARLH